MIKIQNLEAKTRTRKMGSALFDVEYLSVYRYRYFHTPFGTEVWTKDNKRHRDNGLPAVIYLGADRVRYYYNEGVMNGCAQINF
jgi:endo-1,4-beta-D-glucanase Y